MTTSTSSAGPSLSLADLRRRRGRSQAQVASAMGTTQSGVSRIERQPDLKLSTLQEYVGAVGGTLRILIEHEDGVSELAVPHALPDERDERRREYRVIWQDSVTRAFVHVGWLEFTGAEFVFSYTEDAKSNANFEPFRPFPILDSTYRSADLFPLFAVRLTTTADPSYAVILDALGLSSADATPAELLALESNSPHDAIQVVPEPVELDDGSLVRIFLVSGVRHASERDAKQVETVLGTLDVGAALDLTPEPDNEWNPRAIQLMVTGTAIGWVPDYLLDEVHEYLDRGWRFSLTAERVNGPDTPWHLRVLTRLTALPPANIMERSDQSEPRRNKSHR